MHLFIKNRLQYILSTKKVTLIKKLRVIREKEKRELASIRERGRKCERKRGGREIGRSERVGVRGRERKREGRGRD